MENKIIIFKWINDIALPYESVKEVNPWLYSFIFNLNYKYEWYLDLLLDNDDIEIYWHNEIFNDLVVQKKRKVLLFRNLRSPFDLDVLGWTQDLKFEMIISSSSSDTWGYERYYK